MITGITITCFAASYAVALLLEISRLFFRAPVRLAVIVGFTLVGILAHTLHLVNEALAGGGAPLSSWYHWWLMAAWVMAAAYMGLMIRRLQLAVGLFLLPLVLALIGIAWLSGNQPFGRQVALFRWGMVHGIALLLGAVAMTLGFAAGLMYLVQSWRLKHKLPPRQGFKLPNLEWLQRFNKEALLISTCLLLVGLVSGIVINLINHATDAVKSVPWTDPVVWTSGVLLLWLIASTLFEYFYKPARQGRKVAYLTIASFVFLMLLMGLVLFGPSEHAQTDADAAASVLYDGGEP